MKSPHIFTICCLLTLFGMIGLPQAAIAQIHTVQSTAPALHEPAQTMPAGSGVTGPEIKSRTSEAIGGTNPISQHTPARVGETQTTAAEIKRVLSKSEIEELKDGKLP